MSVLGVRLLAVIAFVPFEILWRMISCSCWSTSRFAMAWSASLPAESAEPEHQRAKEDLAAVLERWIEEMGDRGRTPEPEGLVEEIRRRDEAFWATWEPRSE